MLSLLVDESVVAGLWLAETVMLLTSSTSRVQG
jgi:hypothetical protein